MSQREFDRGIGSSVSPLSPYQRVRRYVVVVVVSSFVMAQRDADSTSL